MTAWENLKQSVGESSSPSWDRLKAAAQPPAADRQEQSAIAAEAAHKAFVPSADRQERSAIKAQQTHETFVPAADRQERSAIKAQQAHETFVPKQAATQPTSAAVQSKDKYRFGDYATDALFQMAKLNPVIGNLLTIDKYTGNTLKNMSSSMIGDAASNAVNLGGTALDTVGTVASKTAAPLSRTAQNMYALSDRLNQESRDSLNDALTGKGKLRQAIVNADVKLGKYGAQAAANLAVPGLGTGLRIIDEAGRSTREYRQSNGESYDPIKAATRGAASAIGVAAGNAAAKGVSDYFLEAPYTSVLQDLFRNQALKGGASAGAYALVDTASNEVGRAATEDDYTPNWKRIGESGVSAFTFGFINEVLQNVALSLRDKAYIQEDVADAQKSFDDAMKVVADPNATSGERKQAVQRAIDTTNYARQRMDDLGLPATRHEVSKAQEALADISEKLKPYLTQVERGYESEIGAQDGLASFYEDVYNAGSASSSVDESASAWQSSSSPTQMPNYSDAVTPREKFVNYSLDYENKNAVGKPEAFERALGYTKENADDLIDQIHKAVTSGKVLPYGTEITEYGIKYKFRLPITGPNGKTKNVIAIYQIDAGTTKPRLVTNYVEGK